MLAICSDLDETPDRRVYREIARFLNTNETTTIGPGVGLEIGNSIYFDMAPNQFAYWNTDDVGREMIRALIRSGHIDCLHSYGDFAGRRMHAARALEELTRHDCRLEVWIDHAAVPTNFGADIMRGVGDLPGAAAYHADLTCDFGVKYVWRGRVTSMIGQNAPPSLRTSFSARHPAASARTFGKEAVKHVLGRFGNPKYAPHGDNRVLFPARLRDGRPVYEFMRSNPCCMGVGLGATGREIGQVLTQKMLDRLVERAGACVFYTHLGKIHDPKRPFDQAAVNAFRRLAQTQHDGSALVSTTRRLLRYLTLRDNLEHSAIRDGNLLMIDARPREDALIGADELKPEDFGGMTFYVPDGVHCRLNLLGRLVQGLTHNPPDETGRSSVTVPWPELSFPDV